ncbi:peptide-methionine (S)-S-oxide reductase MsrA [Paenibacillus sp. MMS20-IR301]|uniref:peptide-methionine (S)-S-oxide reductase MsrA n=1 Tax=Paenibacillus sp. MMS20-IR301 TaxID=2895946 RepID=UPI0028E4C6A5|nr:peptide-methionine (S)-S-oxide reductase MsrA [Paenibacillus sp. MMS20-IR301]WNS41208.1 peptide-methionine (S)-S-oxide reductase MsrA [Paenibacillus sp. MMS20-IR301]
MTNGNNLQTATFAGGCFWCMVKPFDELPGIISVVSGYTGGHTLHPTYEEVCSETTGHREAVQIIFDPERFPYERLLDMYWQQIDPTDYGGQFMDRGPSYRAAIFVHSEEQRQKALQSKEALKGSKRFKAPIVTEILPAAPFYPAEAEHQQYYRTHPLDYKLYQKGSGRDDFTELHWNGREDKKRLRKQLTELEYEVTQNKGTEPPYANEYWNFSGEGIYTDILSGDPLFSSRDKFASGTGWPGFTGPLEAGLVRREADYSGGEVRTLLRSRLSGAYLGQLFFDGPEPARQHYRVNSAALRFIPKAELERHGLGRYAGQFEDHQSS